MVQTVRGAGYRFSDGACRRRAHALRATTQRLVRDHVGAHRHWCWRAPTIAGRRWRAGRGRRSRSPRWRAGRLAVLEAARRAAAARPRASASTPPQGDGVWQRARPPAASQPRRDARAQAPPARHAARLSRRRRGVARRGRGGRAQQPAHPLVQRRGDAAARPAAPARHRRSRSANACSRCRSRTGWRPGATPSRCGCRLADRRRTCG